MDLISRAKNICLSPRTEWPVIAEETTPTGTLITGYVLPLAAIGAVAGFIGGSLIGYSVPFVGTYRTPIMAGLGSAILGLALAVVATFVVGLIVNALAPTFGGQKDSLQAFKVVAYAYTPAWIAGVLQIIPFLGILGILAGLYGIYLLYLGLPKLMKCPEDKAIGYTVVTVICAIVVSFIMGAITAAVIGVGAIGAGLAGGSASSGVADPDSPLGRLQQLGEQMEQAAERAEEAAEAGDVQGQAAAAMEGLGALFGGGTSVEPLAIDALQPFAPGQFAGLPQVDQSSERSGLGAILLTRIDTRYGNGTDVEAELELVDTGGVSGLMAVAGWAAGMEQERRTSDGFERTFRENGRLIHEKSSTSGGENEFGIMIGNRFMVSASSYDLDLDALRAGVLALPLAELEARSDEGVER